MLDTTALETLAKNLYAALPVNLHHIENDIERQFKEILRTAFTQMDLVTREEFDVQTKVLARTREKVEALEELLQSKQQ